MNLHRALALEAKSEVHPANDLYKAISGTGRPVSRTPAEAVCAILRVNY